MTVPPADVTVPAAGRPAGTPGERPAGTSGDRPAGTSGDRRRYRRIVDTDGERWRASRREAFEAHVRAQERADADASRRARPLVAEFVRRAREQGLRPVPLRARAYSGTATYRTRLTGWYLQPAGPLAVGEDGEFYLLVAAPGLAALVRGVHVEPSPPPLAVGRGARDGESMSLQELLERRLAAGETFRRE